MRRSLLIISSLAIVLFSQCTTAHFDIAEIGENLPKKGATVIDADKLIVAPGFIDIHTHCDSRILLKDSMNAVKNFLTQGVTTIVTGHLLPSKYLANDQILTGNFVCRNRFALHQMLRLNH